MDSTQDRDDRRTGGPWSNWRRWVTLLLFLFLLPGAIHAAAFIKIGSWNIENLGKRRGQNAGALAEQIWLSGVDLVALQEIWDNDKEAATTTNIHLTRAINFMNRQTGSEWRYRLFPGRDPKVLGQHCGVAWNARKLSMVGEPHRIEVEYTNAETWKRQPHAVKFATEDGKTDFVVIVLHMKSNGVVENMPPPQAIRQQEAQALVARLAHVKRQFQDKDIVLIGDFNCLNDREPALEEYTTAGFRDLNARNAITYEKAGVRRALDRILVPSKQHEFRASRQYVMTPADPLDHRKRLSDHWLVLTTLRILPDDD